MRIFPSIAAILVLFSGIAIFANEEGYTELDEETGQTVDDLSLIDLFNIEVEAVSKTRENYREVPMSVYVINREEMERWGCQNYFDIFQRVPGYSFYNSDTYGAMGPFYRGLNSIWRLGFSIELMSMQDFGHYRLAPHWFKSAEVVRGPASLMWGTAAIAGLTNFTLRDDLDGMEIYTEGGNLNRYAQDILWGTKFENGDPGDGVFAGWRYSQSDPEIVKNGLRGMLKQSKDYRHDGDRGSQQVIAKLQYKGLKSIVFKDRTKWVAPVYWMGKTWGPGDTVVTQRMIELFDGDKNFGDEMEVFSMRNQYELPFERVFGLEEFPFSFSLYHEWYRKQWHMPIQAFDSQTKASYGAVGKLSLLDDNLVFDFGGDFFAQQKNMDPSFTHVIADTSWGWSWFDDALTPAVSENNNAYLQGSFKFLDMFKIVAGIRGDRFITNPDEAQDRERTDVYMVTGPRIAAMVLPTEDLAFKYMFNSSARPPQGNELTQALGGSVDPERLIAHEIASILTFNDMFKIDLTLFYQAIVDRITGIRDGTGDIYYINTEGSYTAGADYEFKFIPNKWAYASLNGSVWYSKADSGKGGVSDAKDDEGRLLGAPMATNYFNLSFNVLDYFHIAPSLRLINMIPYEKGETTYENGRAVSYGGSGEYDMANAFFLDLSLKSRSFWDDRIDLTASILNILDTENEVPAYGEHLGNLIPGTLKPQGRRASIILRVRL